MNHRPSIVQLVHPFELHWPLLVMACSDLRAWIKTRCLSVCSWFLHQVTFTQSVLHTEVGPALLQVRYVCHVVYCLACVLFLDVSVSDREEQQTAKTIYDASSHLCLSGHTPTRSPAHTHTKSFPQSHIPGHYVDLSCIHMDSGSGFIQWMKAGL